MLRGFKLRIYWCLWILSATITVISWVITASSRSACRVFSFWVLCPATQKLSFKWLMDFSTLTRILLWNPILVSRGLFPGKHGGFVPDKYKSFFHRERMCMGCRRGRYGAISWLCCLTPISFWGRRISWLGARSANGTGFPRVSLAWKERLDSRGFLLH